MADPMPDPQDGKADGFGPATATFVVVSSMVGTGILTTTGYMLLDLRSGLAVLLLWGLGGILALCGALSLAEVAAALPRSGGEYAILRETYGPRLAFLSGWVTLWLGFGGPIAASASASASYLLAPLGLSSGDRLAVRAAASLAIVALTAVHCLGRAHTARVQGAITTFKVGFLAALVVVGLGWGHARWSSLGTSPGTAGPSKVLLSLVYVSYAFTGWNGAAYIGGEVRDGSRWLPRSILIGTLLVTALYLGLNVFYVLGVPVETIEALAPDDESRDAVEPIAELAARELFGPVWSGRLSVVLGLLLLGSLSAMILTGPRVAYAMARDGQFPAIAGRLWGAGQTPAVATMLVSGAALVLLWSGSFEWIVLFSGIGLAAFSLPTVAAVIVLRRTRPDLARPFRVPGYPWVPLVFLAITLALLAAAVREEPGISAATFGVILAGLPLYEAIERRRRLAAGRIA
jgi:APA family basic amino acid/polyamine antiporter